MGGLLLRNCDVLRFFDRQPAFSFHQDIQVVGNRITQITPTGSLPTQPDLQVIEAGGLLAVPGMINTHAHVPMVLFRGVAEDVTLEDWFNHYIFPLESNLTPEDVYWGALLGMAEMIEAGITSVADHYFYMDDVARAVQESGLRANLVWAVFEHEGLGKLEESIQFIQRWQGAADGRITTWLGPHSPYLCSPDFLRTCAQRAVDLNVGIHLHVSETASQVELSRQRYGVTPVQLLLDTGVMDRPCIFAHCLYPTEEDLDIMADHPVGVGQAPKTYLRAGMGLGPLKGYQSRNIPVGLATDGAASSSTLDLYEQMRLMAMTQKFLENDARAMPLAEILQIAYTGGACVLRQPELGELEPGKLADIVLLRQDRAAAIPRLNPAANLVYALGAADVDTVICNGKVLMKNRRLLTLDKGRIKQEVESRLERLSQRVPGRQVAVYPT
jgi:5-methylthioadenosine/S-adenosylhomocysteine deaminase